MRAQTSVALPTVLVIPALLAVAVPSNGVGDALGSLFSERYLPHRYCYLAQPGLIWSNAISDALIALSYVALFSYLMFIARRLYGIPEVREYTWILAAFGTFILTCGATHLMEVVTVWRPFYPLAAVLKVICAAVSVPTALYFSGIAPALPGVVESLVSSRRANVERPDRNRGLSTVPPPTPIAAPAQVPRNFSKETILLRMFSRGLVLAILLNIGLTLVLRQSTRNQAIDSDWVTHTQAVRAALATTLRHLQDVGIGGRLFALTGEEIFLDPYPPGRAAVIQDFDLLRSLTADDPAQQSRLDVLGPELTAYRSMIDAMVATRRNSDRAPQVAQLEQDKQALDRARTTIQDMELEQEILLNQRMARAQESRRTASILVWVGGLLNILFLGASAIVLVQQVRAIVQVRMKLDALNDELEQRVDQRTADLQAANKELEEFAYVASHDLKAPLRVIDNASKWLEEDLGEHLTGETKESLDLMRGRIKRMEKLLDDLLAHARLGQTADPRYVEMVAGDVLVGDVIGLLDTRQFTITVSPAFADIRLPRMPIQQILMNLVGNAIKHHDKPPGRIEIGVSDLDMGPDGRFEFTVKDDGPGIAPQFHEQIFKMFQTLRPRDQVEGSGMGLAFVRKLVNISGGSLSLESAVGAGSTFRVSLPKRRTLAAAA